MTVKDWLLVTQAILGKAGITTARLDALVLLEECTGKDRGWLLAHPEFEISDAQVGDLKKLLSRRSMHEPLAYLRGKSEFYGREFMVNKDVLEPRPESETMIDLCLGLLQADSLRTVADVGTGSGAIGITIALEAPQTQLELLEIDAAARKVAQFNVDKFTLPITVLSGDLLSGSKQNNQMLLCNLPYVPDEYEINAAATHEPPLALFGGPDGLDLYRRLFQQVSALSDRPLYILTESLPEQHSALQQIAAVHGHVLHETKDFIQVFTTSTLT